MNTDQNPYETFLSWYQEATSQTSFEPTKMALATVGMDGLPSARMVLLKKYDDRGFCFFTNYESQKSQELLQTPKAALLFHWEKPTHRQVRIRGTVEKMSFAESNEYFQTRSRGSQLGAWASPQSQTLKNRDELLEKLKEMEEKFPEGSEIPCPEFWGGFRLLPESYEFWQSEDHRLHRRIRIEKAGNSWNSRYLAP